MIANIIQAFDKHYQINSYIVYAHYRALSWVGLKFTSVWTNMPVADRKWIEDLTKQIIANSTINY